MVRGILSRRRFRVKKKKSIPVLTIEHTYRLTESGVRKVRLCPPTTWSHFIKPCLPLKFQKFTMQNRLFAVTTTYIHNAVFGSPPANLLCPVPLVVLDWWCSHTIHYEHQCHSSICRKTFIHLMNPQPRTLSGWEEPTTVSSNQADQQTPRCNWNAT